ncbi:hypothetical protein K466DRAFT_604135 [Polyporus arcularius HHB13444]|uniref:Uncharacterized protein n=1 Tax=Polyporus arcularius HHB13444 TaxID=1314778 RepID=A0A5C3NWW9_9APHY|nr:hypothetical protein K466DRAFT_604135 [Polyporus arcularius HHB13444]
MPEEVRRTTLRYLSALSYRTGACSFDFESPSILAQEHGPTPLWLWPKDDDRATGPEFSTVAQRMPSGTHTVNIVGQTVNRHLPSNAELRKHVPVCEGHRHGYQASYGKTTLENLGIVFGWCDKQCRDFHKKPLKKQMSAEQRWRCMRELLAMSELPRGYHAKPFNAFCQAEAQKARELMRGDRAHAISSGVATPTSSIAVRTTSETTARSTRTLTNTQPSKRSIGRPRFERIEVLVLLFHEKQDTPITIHAEGKVHEPLVNFQSGQTAFRNGLDRAFGDGCRPLLDMWNPVRGSWEPAPKSTDVQTLLRGEGRIYKARKVREVSSAEFFPRSIFSTAHNVVSGQSKPASIEFVEGSSRAVTARKRPCLPSSSTPSKRRAVQVTGSGRRPIFVLDSDDDVLELSDSEDARLVKPEDPEKRTIFVLDRDDDVTELSESEDVRPVTQEGTEKKRPIFVVDSDDEVIVLTESEAKGDVAKDDETKNDDEDLFWLGN